MNKIASTHINACRVTLVSLLSEIEEQEYTTIAEVKAAIELDLKILNDVEADNYAKSATLDHMTENQFNV